MREIMILMVNKTNLSLQRNCRFHRLKYEAEEMIMFKFVSSEFPSGL